MAFGRTPYSIVSLGSAISDYTTEYYLSFAAGSSYSGLEKLQCKLTFLPTTFQVNVSFSEGPIRVSPTTNRTNPPPDPEPRGILRSQVMQNFNMISMVQTSSYLSVVGEAFMDNIYNVRSLTKTVAQLNREPATPGKIRVGVKASVEAMADDILESAAAYSLTNPAYYRPLHPVQFICSSVQIGDALFFKGALALNLVAFACVLVATLSTRFWIRHPKFDFADVGAICAAVYLGTREKFGGGFKSDLHSWGGKAREPALNSMFARFRYAGRYEGDTMAMWIDDLGATSSDSLLSEYVWSGA